MLCGTESADVRGREDFFNSSVREAFDPAKVELGALKLKR